MILIWLISLLGTFHFRTPDFTYLEISNQEQAQSEFNMQFGQIHGKKYTGNRKKNQNEGDRQILAEIKKIEGSRIWHEKPTHS